jgi:hypothetical protein
MTDAQADPRDRPAIGLVTYSDLPSLDDGDWPLRDALLARGFRVEAPVWDDPAVDWPSLDLCVIRSTWDYHHRLDEFLAWAGRVSPLTRLWNPPDVLRWNTHKTYLRDLSERGVPVVSTEWLDCGSTVNLAELMQARGWDRAVVKPTVSASAYATKLITTAKVPAGQAHLDDILSRGDAMVQPFIASVETYLERSLLFVDSHMTHAVSRPSQLRSETVPEDTPWYDEYLLVTPTGDELALARHALVACGYDTLYARVDIVRDDLHRPRLIELELVEPSLFLDLYPPAADTLADAIAARCG